MFWVRTITKSLLLFMIFIVPAKAGENSRIFVPDPPKGNGQECVEETAFMRKNHMDLLMHQRDRTVIEGIRTKKHSLKECVSCHSVSDEYGSPVSYQDPKNFCRSCHDYTAVKIDCFECHASKPSQRKGHAKRQHDTLPSADNAYRVTRKLPQ
jgi:hypothetical protein